MAVVRTKTQAELERILAEVFVNGTSIVNKISPNSITSAFIKANAKVAAKSYKELALSTSSLFPQTASGTALDEAAETFGISERQGARASSVAVKVIADPGTFYDASLVTIDAGNGITYELVNDLTIGASGIAYANARSITTGEDTTIEAFEVTDITPNPVGHISITNPFGSFGGSDLEDDDAFRNRIINGANIASVGTLDKYAEIFRRINENVLRVLYYGTNVNGKVRLGIVSTNGQDFSTPELDEMLTEGEKFFPVNELSIAGTQSQSVQLENINYQWIDLDFRIEISQNFDFINTIREIQSELQDIIDFRFWKPGDRLEWEDILTTVQNTRGVRYVPDSTFIPRNDIKIDKYSLPRFRDFIVRDLQGNVILDTDGIISPIFFPNEEKFMEFGDTVI